MPKDSEMKDDKVSPGGRYSCGIDLDWDDESDEENQSDNEMNTESDFSTTPSGHIDSPRYSNMTPLHVAYLEEVTSAEKFHSLLTQEGVDLNAICDEGTESYSDESTEKVDVVNDAYALEKATLLLFATAQEDVAMVKALCETGKVKLNARGDMVLNKSLLSKPSFLGIEDSENMLTEEGELMNVVYAYEGVHHVLRIRDVTALHLAARHCNQELVKYLLSQGASPDMRDSIGKTPLDYLQGIKKYKIKRMKEYDPDVSYSQSIDHISMKEIDAVISEFSYARAKPANVSPNEMDVRTDNTMQAQATELKQVPSDLPERTRLCLGEAAFKFSEAKINKRAMTRPGYASTVTATEYDSYENEKKEHGELFEARIAKLKEKGVDVQFGIDATKLHQTESLKNGRYSRIHFNFPLVAKKGERYSYKSRDTANMLAEFFKSASLIQQAKDKIYMALPYPDDEDDRSWRQSYCYNIFEAAAHAGYVLVHKRPFTNTNFVRYEGYQHAQTVCAKSALVAEKSREFVFKKTTLTYEEILKHSEYGPGELYRASRSCNSEEHYTLKQLDTDNDSSDEEDANEKYAALIAKQKGPMFAKASPVATPHNSDKHNDESVNPKMDCQP